MIVSFTGAQSTGKTTLLNHLVDKNPYVTFVEEVTRRVKREFNLPINEDGGNVTQYMIMADHVANVYRKTESELTVLDRCAVDGVVYTRWLQLQGMVDAEVYTAACCMYNNRRGNDTTLALNAYIISYIVMSNMQVAILALCFNTLRPM